MKKTLAILLSVLICVLSSCHAAGDSPVAAETVLQTEPILETTEPTEPFIAETTISAEEPTEATEETVPQSTVQVPKEETVSETTVPQETKQKETTPPMTESTAPVEIDPTEATQPATDAQETEPPATEAETEPATEPEIWVPDYAFKQQVAAYAAQYINQYRSSPCTVLSGMSQVAQYRAGQLCYNFSHSTSDKRAALAYYEYGRWIDATVAGLDASQSYYESDTSEAICRGFRGSDAETLGKAIADLIYSSGSHWTYVGSSEYNYMGIGVEYCDDSYGWYCCVMVGTVDYG